MIGKSLGPYKIIEQLGAGGMGEVYLGEDTRLGRKVAIKVLPAEFASDPERLARFEQEARAAAALNHPHIAVVHDVGFDPGERPGEAEAAGVDPAAGATTSPTGTHFIVQEYLEGQSLRERLHKGALPLDKALGVATEVGEALIAAHRAGIIHRDLKPDNVFLTEEGHAKVLDFGLAKLTAPAPSARSASMSPTMLGTVAGQVMGTAGYMAPEQVQAGGEVDERADLFAFGCVLYEAVGGKRAFDGETALDTLHAIVREEPQPLGEINADLPAELQRILRRCLAKDVSRRYQTAADLTADLRVLQDDVAAGVTTPISAAAEGLLGAEGTARPPRQQARWLLSRVPLPIAAALAVITAALVWLAPRPAPGPSPVSRFEVPLPWGLSFSGTGRRVVAISPDGTRVVFNAGESLWLRPIDGLEATPIRGTQGARSVFFSPDGQQVGFYAGGQMRTVSIMGGAPTAWGPAINPHGASWEEDGHLYFGQGERGIYRVALGDEQPQVVVAVAEGERMHGPQLLPGGQWLLFTLRPAGVGDWNDAQIVVQRLGSQEREVVLNGGRDARYVSTGHLVYYRHGSLWAVPFDARDRRLAGEPTVILEGLSASEGSTGAAHFAIAANGTLVYWPGPIGGVELHELVWLGPEDDTEEPLGIEPGDYNGIAFSPGGDKVAVSRFSGAGRDIWVWDSQSRSLTRVSFGEDDFNPAWNTDGTSVLFASGRPGAADRDIYVVPADGSSTAVPFYEADSAVYPLSATPDGGLIIFAQRGSRRSQDVLLLDAEGELVGPILDTEFDETAAILSPDGRWLAYVSNESEQDQVLVRRFPGPSGRLPVSQAGATSPRWAPDGRTVYYIYEGSVWSASMSLDGEPAVVERRPLFSVAGYGYDMGGIAYDVHPETGRFLFVKNPAATSRGFDERPHLIVTLNWFEELKRLSPAGR